MRADGIITTGAHRDRLVTAFRPVLDHALEGLARIEGAPALYVYGSVATGTARPGLSDVDLVAVGIDADAALAWGQALTTAFTGLCRGVEVGASQPSDYAGTSDEAHGNRVFLRHYCVHLAGPDLRRDLPDCPADRAAARGFNGDIRMCADRWRRELAGGSDRALLARRIARKTLFAVAGLVSVHDSTWTTDRLAAAKRFGAIEPSLAAPLDTLLDWGGGAAVAPSAPEVERMLDGAVAKVVQAFEARIGLWRPAAPHATA